jgi:predicted permease
MTMSAVKQDVVYGMRSLRKTPAFTATVVLTLTLGIGANSAIFSVVDAVLLRPLPFPQAERVVNVAWDGSGYLQALSATKFQYWRDHARSFDAMATWQSLLARVEIGGEVSAARTLRVSHDFLQVLGYAPAVGRGFVAAEYSKDGSNVAMISHGAWRTHFGSSGDVVGRAIRVNGEPFTIVGVLPESFEFPYENAPVTVIVPVGLTVDPNDVAEDWPAIARIGKGTTREQAEAEVSSLNVPFRAAYPTQASERDRGMILATFAELYVNATVGRALWILMGAVTLVLLIACANVANLILARVARRRGEIALRAALGASRARIIRLVLTESVLVAGAAGVLGLLLGRWVAALLVALTPMEVPRLTSAGIDLRLTLFTFAVSLATSLFFGGAAAWPAAHARVAEVLQERSRGVSGRSRIRAGLLIAQSGLSMVLLVGAGLLASTLIGLMRVDPGFDSDGLVAARIAAKPPGYDTSQDLWRFEQRVMQHLERAPAVRSIAATSSLPLERGINTPMSITGRPDASGTVEWRAVTPDYFRTLGIALVAGRTIEDTDITGRPAIAVINEAFARRYFPGESPIGQRIDVGRIQGKRIDPALAGPGVEIVGVVSDVREISLRTEPRRTMYVPQAQASTRLSTLRETMPVFIAKSRSGAAGIERAFAEAIRAVDPALPAPQVFPINDVVARSLVRERFGATLLSVLAILALTLTAFGVYGVLAYTIQQRRREIGIRIALGASGRDVARLVIVQGVAPVLVGVFLGVLGSLGLSRVVSSFLWGVTPTDPSMLAATAAMLIGVALAASWIPAREAVRLDPVTAINTE